MFRKLSGDICQGGLVIFVTLFGDLSIGCLEGVRYLLHIKKGSPHQAHHSDEEPFFSFFLKIRNQPLEKT